MFEDKKILLIEDSEADVNLFKIALEENQFSPQKYLIDSGSESIKYFKNQDPNYDLIILDINLPMYNGYEIFEQIKLKNIDIQTPVIIFTGSNSESDKEKCKDYGFGNFYTKPAHFKEYVSTVKDCLSNNLINQ
ncbi:MAG: response regulator [Candidatus Caenarcaniphilales bacterium]|nr:response regulator [Candidatus Caenarcaniphilales bacterium]